LLETVLRESNFIVFFTANVVLGVDHYELFVERARKMGIRQFMKRKTL